MHLTRPANADLSSAVSDAEDRYATQNPKSYRRWQDATRAMPGGNTRTTLHYSPFPLGIAGGQGITLTDLDGHSYTDLLADYTAGLYGHSNPAIVKAVTTALEAGVMLGGPNLYEAELASMLVDRIPALDLVRFCNSGTEANLLAIITARAFTKRNKIMVFHGGYHGATFVFPKVPTPVTAPFDWVMADFNDPEGVTALAREHADDLAAILLEPMMGNAGGIPAEPGFLQTLRTLADETGALLIFDEVMTSRMSEGGLQKLVGVTPDMTTLGKYLGGGMTFGAFGGRADIMSLYDPTRPGTLGHGGTFNNNVLTMAAGAAGLREVFTPDAAATLYSLGEMLRDGINACAAKHGSSLIALGTGSIMNLHFHKGTVNRPQDLWDTDPEVAARKTDKLTLLHLDLLERGYYIARRGLVCPALPVTRDDIDGFIAAVDEILTVRGNLLA